MKGFNIVSCFHLPQLLSHEESLGHVWFEARHQECITCTMIMFRCVQLSTILHSGRVSKTFYSHLFYDLNPMTTNVSTFFKVSCYLVFAYLWHENNSTQNTMHVIEQRSNKRNWTFNSLVNMSFSLILYTLWKPSFKKCLFSSLRKFSWFI